MVEKERYRDRESAIIFFDFQPSKMELALGFCRIQIIVFFIFQCVLSVNRQIFGDYFEMCHSLSFWSWAL